MTHICVSKLTIIGSDNGLSPGRRQAIIWTNAGILLIGPLETNFIEISIAIQTFAIKKCTWRCRLRNGGHVVCASMCQSNCVSLKQRFSLHIQTARSNTIHVINSSSCQTVHGDIQEITRDNLENLSICLVNVITCINLILLYIRSNDTVMYITRDAPPF